MPWQHPRKWFRNGTDSRTNVKELLVAQDEHVDTRVCQVLWYLCSIQGSQASPIWTPMALADSQPTLGIYCNGLHHRPPYYQSQWLNLGCGRSSHQDGPFHPLFQIDHGRRNSSIDSGQDCSTAWIPWGNCVRQRPSISIQVLVAPIWVPWSRHSAIFSFPPRNRWTNRTDKLDTRAISPLHCELLIRQLTSPAISSRVCL